jgi:hypothetical protein
VMKLSRKSHIIRFKREGSALFVPKMALIQNVPARGPRPQPPAFHRHDRLPASFPNPSSHPPASIERIIRKRGNTNQPPLQTGSQIIHVIPPPPQPNPNVSPRHQHITVLYCTVLYDTVSEEYQPKVRAARVTPLRIYVTYPSRPFPIQPRPQPRCSARCDWARSCTLSAQAGCLVFDL